MSKQTRIGIIRAAIEKQGGSTNITYYADNTKGCSDSKVIQDSGDAVYKVEQYSDGLTKAKRQLVVDELNKHPEVKRAYLSRPTTAYRYGLGLSTVGGHIKVVFDGIHPDTVQRRTKARANRKRR